MQTGPLEDARRDEHVLAAVIGNDEAEAFFGAIELHRAFDLGAFTVIAAMTAPVQPMAIPVAAVRRCSGMDSML